MWLAAAAPTAHARDVQTKDDRLSVPCSATDADLEQAANLEDAWSFTALGGGNWQVENRSDYGLQLQLLISRRIGRFEVGLGVGIGEGQARVPFATSFASGTTLITEDQARAPLYFLYRVLGTAAASLQLGLSASFTYSRITTQFTETSRDTDATLDAQGIVSATFLVMSQHALVVRTLWNPLRPINFDGGRSVFPLSPTLSLLVGWQVSW
jgi:hypothetical protein